MKFLSKRSLKSKLFILAGFPTVVLIIFVSYFLIDEYRTLLETKKMESQIKIVQMVEVLVTDLRDISSTALHLSINQKSDLENQQEESRKEAILHLQQFKEYIEKERGEIEDVDLSNRLEGFWRALEELFTEADFKKQPANEWMDKFSKEQLNGISVMFNIIDKAEQGEIAWRMFAYLALFEEEVVNGLQRALLYQAIKKGSFEANEFDEFRSWDGMQDGYGQMYLLAASPDEEKYYYNYLNQSAYIEADKMINHVLEIGRKGPFDIDPDTWWQTQTEKINLLNNMQEKILNTTNERTNTLLTHSRLSFYGSLAALIILLVIIALLGRAIFHNILRPLNAAGQLATQVGSEVSQILSNVSEASAATVQTAAAVTETTTTTEELKQTAQVAVEKAKNVSEATGEAFHVLKTSESAVDATIDGMNKIHEGMKTISESILKLSDRCKAIGDIIDTVNDLAQQSNLLAVNAAIEAAKAGDQGKGFGVVAQEVRSLAEQSKQATVQVRSLLNEIQKATNTVVMASEQGVKAVVIGMSRAAETSQSIHSLSTGVTMMSRSATQIAASSQEQLIGIGQVNEAMNQIKEAADHHSDRIRQIEEAVQKLHAAGINLQELVEKTGI